MKRKIGEGTFAKIYANKSQAIKRFKTNNDYDCDCKGPYIEISIMKQLEYCEYIMHIDKINVKTFKKYEFYMQQCPNSIRDLIDQKSIIEIEAKRYFYQLLIAMYNTHNYNITHADIKPENIMVDNENNIKLIDWNTSIIKYSNSKTNLRQTACYRAPEVIFGCRKYKNKIDIWSCALVFLEMISGERVINVKHKNEIFPKLIEILGWPNDDDFKVLKKLPDFKKYFKKYKNQKPKNFEDILSSLSVTSSLLGDLLIKMLCWNPKKRISAVKALNHPYFADLRSKEYVKLTQLSKLNNVSIPKLTYKFLLTNKNRTLGLDLIVEMCKGYGLGNLAIFVAITYFDLISTSYNYLIAVASSVFLASNINSDIGPDVSDLVHYLDYKIKKDDISMCCDFIFAKLSYNLYIRTLYHDIHLILKMMTMTSVDCYYQDLLRIVYNPKYINYKSTAICLAIILKYQPKNDFVNTLKLLNLSHKDISSVQDLLC